MKKGLSENFCQSFSQLIFKKHIAAYYSVQKAQPAEAKAISMKDLAEKCDRCHGPGMENPMMILPKIHGQNKGYLVKALKAYRDNKRGSSPMRLPGPSRGGAAGPQDRPRGVRCKSRLLGYPEGERRRPRPLESGLASCMLRTP